MTEALLSAKDVSCQFDGKTTIFSGISFDVNPGDILVLSGKSGSGKTTLLKCLAHLNLYGGKILYRGKPPTEYGGIPVYRTHVLYVPQRPSLLPSNPRAFLNTVLNFNARKGKNAPPDPDRPVDIAESWGIDPELWDRDWASLSGGEAQRIALSVAVGLGMAEILLLDEPTSALDAETSALVEKELTSAIKSHGSNIKALIWITHSEEQGKRVGTRALHMESGHVESVGAENHV
ncbi:P-loop containing nucleoside triphosphate hydrolase protein [Sistotremastrum niveocremeum HHB9708]|uniref:p-loop containing nucleoside triphosphate hydrolase protein n=2 Tax=Sistotremastraceae TaxID=3402574 RepID=A0A165AM28_9AGAM|nr:P-loop containing nucleoside triphosphate hydrolase protein [Sistotremastrum niveocremeum HHB9708]KZT42079.1 P-loop containing nucleoside triphosphate hydrolase protein [Sistotremastrum suecicum HHB10207 ss-3]